MNNVTNDIFDTKMAMIVAMQKQPELPDVEKKKIATAYLQMYSGLVMTKWLTGEKLGGSMYTAMEQVKSFMDTKKDANNPALMYMRQYYAAHRALQSKHMMDEKIKNEVFQVKDAQQRKEYAMRASAEVNKGIAEINKVIEQFKAQVKQASNAKPQATADKNQSAYDAARKKMQMILMLKMQQYQNQRGSMAA